MRVADDHAIGPVFDHLASLSDDRGLFEHARLSRPRPEHGYCLDDVARGLVVVCREPEPDRILRGLAELYLDFTLTALQPDGSCHNRMAADGRWSDSSSLGDWWGRAVWGLGVAATRAPTSAMRARALLGFRTAAPARSPHLRSMVFAALGAGEVLRHHPDEIAAVELVRAAVTRIGVAGPVEGVASGSAWPEERLTYGNGAVVEALLVGGSVLDDRSVSDTGLRLLDFLLRLETRDGHFSVTPVGGRDLPFAPAFGAEAEFDQQPIEIAALADACARAFEITGEDRWRQGVRMAWAWFCGDNDSSTPMFDAVSGGGYDGLEAGGCNLNQGAESTLAMLSTAQQARRLGVVE